MLINKPVERQGEPAHFRAGSLSSRFAFAQASRFVIFTLSHKEEIYAAIR